MALTEVTNANSSPCIRLWQIKNKANLFFLWKTYSYNILVFAEGNESPVTKSAREKGAPVCVCEGELIHNLGERPHRILKMV